MAKKKPQQQSTAKSTDIALPPKPPRLAKKGPGVEVELVTNLFKISLSLKKERDIFCHTIQIDPPTHSQKPSASGDSSKPSVQRKIPKDLRQKAVRNAVEQWFENNSVPNVSAQNSFVLDGDGSTMYSLFKMLDLHDGQGNRNHLSFVASVDSPKIVDKTCVMKPENMVVRFYAPTRIDVRAMIDDYCSGKKMIPSNLIQGTLKALNVILTGKIIQIPNYLGMQAKNGSCSVFDYSKVNQFQISQGIFCNKGFISSVRATERGLVANIANSVVPFYEPLYLTEFIAKRFGDKVKLSDGLPPRIIDELRKELRLKQVEAVHRNYGTKDRPHYRKYRVHDIGGSTIEEKFELDDPKTGKRVVSVFDYFKKEYPGCKLNYPKLPCIIDNKRKIPLELCRLVDKQKVNRRLNPLETSNVIKEAAMRPERHFKQVEDYAKRLDQHTDYWNEFGLQFDRTLIELKGRELPPIKLWAARQFSLNTREGAYEASRAQFVKSPKIDKWALIILADERFKRSFRNLDEARSDCAMFAKRYCATGQSKGVQISNLNDKDLIIISVSNQDHDLAIKKKLRETFVTLNQTGFNHAICILPASRDWIYGYMQYLEVDVPRKIKLSRPCTKASCIKDENFVKKVLGKDPRNNPRNIDMFINNLWLKYNTKLGGVNFVLDANQNFGIPQNEFNNFLQPGYLFVSIDVCHPAPGDKLEQSVAAAVGMWNITNPNMSTCTRVRVQRKESSDKEKSTVEQVGDIGLMFDEIIQSYHKGTGGKLPTHIVILRDGVSDGQFHMVLQFELSQIRSCIKNFYSKMKVKDPLLSCLTIQKRHRTRFMRKVPFQTRKGPDYNIQPGTVVDHTVVEPQSHSFYLAPHKAIQGTARAPHSYIIYDEIKFSQDSAQAMIFALSYLSPRCTKGTSIPTPVNLADLAAERGKHIVVSWNEDNPQRLAVDDRLVQLNAFLSSMGDQTYHNTLYYV